MWNFLESSIMTEALEGKTTGQTGRIVSSKATRAFVVLHTLSSAIVRLKNITEVKQSLVKLAVRAQDSYCALFIHRYRLDKTYILSF